jgi:hypothetical protein
VQGLKVEDFKKREDENLKTVEEMLNLAETYNKWIQDEMKKLNKRWLSAQSEN